MPRPGPSQDPQHRPDLSVEAAAHKRDQGRRRIKATTRWAVAAAVAGTAVLGAGYAYAIPGSSGTTVPPATAPSGGATTPGGGTSTAPSQPSGGLRSPAQAPAPTTQPPQTTSGGS